MSKFFDGMQKAQELASGEGAGSEPPVQEGLNAAKHAVQQTDAVASDRSDLRLHECRKIRLPQNPVTPSVFGASNEPAHIAAEAYRTLRTRLIKMQATQGLRSVIVSSASPGEGKSLTVLNLAHYCAQLENYRVLVIDGDLRTRGLTKMIGSPVGPGLGEILAKNIRYESAILASDVPNLYFVAAGSQTSSPAELFASHAWKAFIGSCSENFKLVLVDSPPVFPLADFELMVGACDRCLVVVRALRVRRDLLQKAAGQIDPKKLLGVVFNGTEAGRRSGYYYPAGSSK